MTDIWQPKVGSIYVNIDHDEEEIREVTALFSVDDRIYFEYKPVKQPWMKHDFEKLEDCTYLQIEIPQDNLYRIRR